MSKNEEEKRRQRRLGKENIGERCAAAIFATNPCCCEDPSTNKARQSLLSETAEQIFQIGDLELPLLVPAYVRNRGHCVAKVSQTYKLKQLKTAVLHEAVNDV